MSSPPVSPSRTREGAAIRRDFSLDSLETREQDIIQHVRTAGLRKPRETALVDELLAIRKERRQIFSALVGHIVRLQTTRQQLTDDLEQQASAQREMRSLHQQELKKMEETHATELQHQVQRLSRRYEDKLRLIGSKVEEVASARRRDQQSEAESLAQQMTAAALGEAEKKHDEKLLRFKEALRSVAEKEKEMEAVAQKQAGLARAYQREAQNLKLQLEEQKSIVSSLSAKEKTATTVVESMRASLKAEQMDSGALRVELGRVRDQAQAEMRSLNEAHGEQLLQIEDRVKAAVSKKDALIVRLKAELRDTQESKRAAEQVLADLQAGLSFR